jgi:paraquat-inducible protein B
MIINNNSVEQINVALNDVYAKIDRLNINTSDLDSIKTSIANIQRTLNETKNGLSSGETYNINISGNAATATHATTAGSATHADAANSATTAGSATTAVSATKDGDGNTISTTYQKVSGMSNYQAVSEKNAVAGYVNCNQTANGNYKLRATVSNGTVTYSWVADN